LIININKTYNNGKRKNKNKDSIYDRQNIYEATRGWWRLDISRANNIDYVLTEYKGVIRVIFKPQRWLQNIERDSRWGGALKEMKLEEKKL